MLFAKRKTAHPHAARTSVRYALPAWSFRLLRVARRLG